MAPCLLSSNFLFAVLCCVILQCSQMHRSWLGLDRPGIWFLHAGAWDMVPVRCLAVLYPCTIHIMLCRAFPAIMLLVNITAVMFIVKYVMQGIPSNTRNKSHHTASCTACITSSLFTSITQIALHYAVQDADFLSSADFSCISHMTLWCTT